MPMPRGRQRGRAARRADSFHRSHRSTLIRRTMAVGQGNRPTLKLSVLREEIPDYDLL